MIKITVGSGRSDDEVALSVEGEKWPRLVRFDDNSQSYLFEDGKVSAEMLGEAGLGAGEYEVSDPNIGEGETKYIVVV